MTSATTIAALLAVYAAGEGERMSEPKWIRNNRIWRERSDGSRWVSFGDPVQGPHLQFDFYGSPDEANLFIAGPELYDALSALLDANDAVQMVLCDGPEVPGFDPNALGAAQTKVVEAEELARQALAKARGES